MLRVMGHSHMVWRLHVRSGNAQNSVTHLPACNYYGLWSLGAIHDPWSDTCAAITCPARPGYYVYPNDASVKSHHKLPRVGGVRIW